MNVDIFSAFDPATNFILNSPLLFTLSLILFCVFFLSVMWLPLNFSTFLLMPVLSFIAQPLSRGTPMSLKGIKKIIPALFTLIILVNLLGLIPFVFSFSSHLLFTLSFGLPLWITLIITSFMSSPMKFTAGLMPSGAPSWLAPALVIIETISILVRPITLSFRLAANMSAGHVVLGLVNIYMVGAINSSTPTMVTLLSISAGYTMFEIGICVVQGYIFCLLLSLYADEHTT